MYGLITERTGTCTTAGLPLAAAARIASPISGPVRASAPNPPIAPAITGQLRRGRSISNSPPYASRWGSAMAPHFSSSSMTTTTGHA